MDIKFTEKVLELKDYSVTGDTFELYLNAELELLKTSPQPVGVDLDRYYDSEDYISHTDAKRDWFEKAYQLVKGITIQFKVKLIEGFELNGKTILDIGCGTGDFLVAAQKVGWKTIGLEPNTKAKKIVKNKGISIIESLELLESNSIDLISMWHVLEHVPDLNSQITTIKRVLKKDGILLVAVPNYKSYDASYYKRYWAAYDVPRHLWHFSQTSIQLLFKKYEFTLENKYPMWFDSFYVSLLSEKYMNGKSNIRRAFWIGLKSNWKAKKSSEFSSIIYKLRKSEVN